MFKETKRERPCYNLLYLVDSVVNFNVESETERGGGGGGKRKDRQTEKLNALAENISGALENRTFIDKTETEREREWLTDWLIELYYARIKV